MFVASTGRSASTRMSTSGWLRRSSNATKTPRTATPPSSATIVFPEPQPHAFAFEMPSSSAASPSESSAAPAQSIRVRSRAGEAGTTRWTRSAAGSASSPIQKSQEMSVLSTMAPDRGRPMPPPMPNIAEIIPMATERRSAGSSSLMIPKASGNTPPATPWITRPAMTTSIEPASADTIEPKEKMSSTPVSTRALPNRSPSFPASGVHTEAESRNPVSTQDVVEDSVPNSRVRAGIAGATSVCARAYASADSRSAPITGAAGLPWTVVTAQAEAAATLRSCGQCDRAVVGDVLGQARVDRVAQVVALRGREVRDALAQPGRELELRVPPVVEAREAEGEVDLVDLGEHEARLLQRLLDDRRVAPGELPRRVGSGGSVAPMRTSSWLGTDDHGLSSGPVHAASATVPPGLSTRRVSRSAAPGSASSM